MNNRIVLNEPHASVEGLYDKELSFWNIDAQFLNDVVIKWTDWYTDILFHGFNDERIRAVRFPYSHFIVDAERLWHDPMESIGQGIVYRKFGEYLRNDSICLNTDASYKKNLSDVIVLLMSMLLNEYSH